MMSLSVKSLAEDKIDIGKLEYNSSCAVCHGLLGKGDGPLKPEMIKPMPDLTILAKKNKGVFPFDLVYQIIDGRKEIKAHGLREMPVWGQSFNKDSSLYFEQHPPFNTESVIRSRILAITEYLYRIQEK
jgi:mono/diheme cytochrome c family protein